MQKTPKSQKPELYHQASRLKRIVARVTITGIIVTSICQVITLGFLIIDHIRQSDSQSSQHQTTTTSQAQIPN
jgi:hypothetical protein